MNKKVIAALIITALFPISIFAQVTLRPGISAGLSVFKQDVGAMGLTLEGDSKTGGVFGGVLDIGVSPYFSIEPGVAYAMRGTVINLTESGITATATEDISYLEIPVHLKAKFPGKKVTPYAVAGVSTGILLSATGTVAAPGQPSVEQDIKDTLKTVDFGLDFGIGMELNLSSVIPYVEIIDYIGLADIAQKSFPISDGGLPTTGSQNTDVKVLNQGWEIKAGIKFKI